MALLCPWSPERYLDASRFAAEAHRGQMVPGSDGLPYLLHVTQVAMEVAGALAASRFDAPDLAIQCALLHDTLEDTAVTEDVLDKRFGAAVVAGVRALTKDRSLPKDQRMADSLTRIVAQPAEVWIVKLADRITNLQPPPGHWSPEKAREYRREAGLILDRLGAASPYLAGRMRDKIAAYDKHLVAPS